MRNRTSAMLLAIAAVCAAPALADQAPASSPKTLSRAGIPYKPDNDQIGPKELVDAIRSRRTGGKLLNLDRILLYSPAFAKGWNSMFGAIRGQLAVPARLRELSIMAIGALNQADYEWAEHESEFLKAGGTQAQLAALKNVPAALNNDKLFDAVDRATLALVAEMTRSIKVSDATMTRIRKLLPMDQVIELIGTIAGYNMVSRFVVATGIEVE
jgi:alkylhydroperoxidase family enzyme